MAHKVTIEATYPVWPNAEHIEAHKAQYQAYLLEQYKLAAAMLQLPSEYVGEPVIDVRIETA